MWQRKSRNLQTKIHSFFLSFQKNLLIIFYTELKQLADKSGHQQMCNPSHRNVTVIGYYRKPKLLIVVFSNNTMQINTVYERSTRPIEILIGYDYVQVFNGTKYLSFTYSEVPAEVVDLIERAKDNFENDVNEDDWSGFLFYLFFL